MLVEVIKGDVSSEHPVRPLEQFDAAATRTQIGTRHLVCIS